MTGRPWALTEQQRKKLDGYLAIDTVQMDVQEAISRHPELKPQYVLADVFTIGLRVLLNQPLPEGLVTSQADV